ncbi:hypothetical protein L873DRAFT_1906772 [Choiromyces venosus 120613-1]|uniref:Uncharacterized protein n=1 Tax=Choiromyces venosus 120613-1 TaxID=1336337 RepID=A0A3N4IRU5_9PEZI|nr:hypothetical protein L873DRAFT_1906772 [Choiromyces venosus 120613-1]
MSPPFWADPAVDNFPSLADSQAQSPPQGLGLALPRLSDALPYCHPSLHEAFPHIPWVPSPSFAPSSPLPGNTVVSQATQQYQSSRLANTQSHTQLNVLLPTPLLSTVGAGPVPSRMPSGLSTPRGLGVWGTTPDYYSLTSNQPHSATQTMIPHQQPRPVPAYYGTPPAGPSKSTGQSVGFSSHATPPPPLGGLMTESAELRPNPSALTS